MCIRDRTQTTKPIKMAVPGAMTVIDSTLDETYHDEGAMAMDVAAALNEELRDLQAAGCDVVQIDEPAMTVIDSTLDETYHDEGAMAMDVAAALNEELRDLQAAGCDVVQIDEPAMT